MWLMMVRGGYYGDMFGVMVICDFDGGMYLMWKGVLLEYVFVLFFEWMFEWE